MSLDPAGSKSEQDLSNPPHIWPVPDPDLDPVHLNFHFFHPPWMENSVCTRCYLSVKRKVQVLISIHGGLKTPSDIL